MQRVILYLLLCGTGICAHSRNANAMSCGKERIANDRPAYGFVATNNDSTGTNTPDDTVIESKGMTILPDPVSPPGDIPVTPVTPSNPDDINDSYGPIIIPGTKNSKYDVGSHNGNLTVSNSGAAVYNYEIDTPDGGGLTPRIGLSYNSQTAGYGLAGYGFGITGISVITRGGHDRFHDNQQKGIAYTADDNYFLDGKRLILQSGRQGHDGSVYTVEGDPYTNVTLHGNSDGATWFEVKAGNGMTYQYGKSPNSRLAFTNGNGQTCIASWYINMAEDRFTNYITYDYHCGDLNIIPTTILYGGNRTESRNIRNKISFTYQGLGENSRAFVVGDSRGKIDACLSSITTSCNDSVYRQYSFAYENSKDKSIGKFTRLVEIDLRNGKGGCLPPVKFEWTRLSSGKLSASQITDVPTKDCDSWASEYGKQYIAVDLNGDGISDIVRLSNVTEQTSVNSNGTSHSVYSCAYISRSEVSPTGEITYGRPLKYTLNTMEMPSEEHTIVSGLMGSCAMDFDGDGYNDLVIASLNRVDGNWNNINYNIIFGHDVAKEKLERPTTIMLAMNAGSQAPLYATFDTDGDGKDDIVTVETGKKDGHYQCKIIKSGTVIYNDYKEKEVSSPKYDKVEIRLDRDPKKIFVGDYNNDGLNDMIFLHDGGYKIYYNNGGKDGETRFCEDNTKSGSAFKDYWRVLQGDFDGDGQIDFLYNEKGKSSLGIAYNIGNGKFWDLQTGNLGISDHSTLKDDSKFSIMVWDMDDDGRSDVMVCKAMYKHRGFPKFKNEYKETRVRWLRSCGEYLRLDASYTKHREDDACESNIFLGDFDGDSKAELANFGSLLNSDDDNFNDRINIYKNTDRTPDAGKIKRVVDGMGINSMIDYSYMTNPLVYKQTIPSKYPVNTYKLPLTVVEGVVTDNGVAGRSRTGYRYEDMRLHVAGRGVLGFGCVTKENNTLAIKNVTRVRKWDEEKWMPKEVEEINHTGNDSTVTVSKYTIENVGNNHLSYISRKDITDLDGNMAAVITEYDVSKGVVTDETVLNEGKSMFRKVTYSGYQNKAGMWLPTVMKNTMKHKDDPSPYTATTTYTYDDRGNAVATVTNSGTPLTLKTTAVYDVYGNVVSTQSTGKGVTPVEIHYDYDVSGRFIAKSYTKPYSTVNTYTYDLWGNLLTESDVTEPTNILTTRHTYDGWGREKSSQSPDGGKVSFLRAWADSYTKKYCVREYASNKPCVTTWYDQTGRELLKETTGTKGVAVTKETEYDQKGNVSKVRARTGDLTVTQSLAYDDRGRVASDVSSSGRSVQHTYGNRSVTTTTAGRSYTKTYDEWGNLKKSTDPGGEVVYEYSSLGKPVRIKAASSEVALGYDVAGNRVTLDDPDAGTSTYSYAADGTLLSQTDGRGIKTVNSYDDIGRLASVCIGGKTIKYDYGTSGNEKLQLVKQTMGDKTVEYTHDRFGRVVTEKRDIGIEGTYTFSYEYDDKNRLAKTSYPGGLDVTYEYDDNGFMTKATAGGHVIYGQNDFNGTSASSSFMGKLTATTTRDKRGYVKNVSLARGDEKLDILEECYEGATGNLISRRRNGGLKKVFFYDTLDRLISTELNVDDTEPDTVGHLRPFSSTSTMFRYVGYADNGNITHKLGVGEYKYDVQQRPHAVTEVENQCGTISGDALTTSFNDLGKIRLIEDAGKGLAMNFAYGPGRERWSSELSRNDTTIRKTIYASNYEKITDNGITREFYYLDGNAIVVKENGVFTPYIAFTDDLGSILSVYDAEGTKVFHADYGEWGGQSINLNTIGLHRGYTGHEMLNEFGIINMNGRLYDPDISRFLSPDNFVQMPDNTQSFNRYSYCLNNPLKYVDPSGEFAWFVPVIAGAIIGAYTGASVQSGTAAFWNWNSNAWKGAITGGIIGATIGYGVSSALASSGGVTCLTTTNTKGEIIVTKSAGITSSILNSGSANIAYNAITGNNWNSAWKAGISGLITGAWTITGGLGMVKGFGAKSKMWKIAGKLGYQIIGTVSQSTGNNWTMGKGLFSKVTLGIGSLNFTLGKGQRILQCENNLGNIVFNSFGLINTAFGGKVTFDTENLTFNYTGGLMDIFQQTHYISDSKLYIKGAGFSPHTITGNSNLKLVIRHELHHLWHSRALNDMYLLNYGLQGLNALLLKGNFVSKRNYYEDFVDNYSWWPTH